MKLAAILTLSTYAFASAASAAEKLPNYLQEKLNDAAIATSVQLDLNDTVEQLASDQEYRQKVTEIAARDLRGWGRAVESSVNSISGASIVGGSGAFMTGLYGPAWHQSGTLIVTDESLSVGGIFLATAGSGLGLHYRNFITNAETVKYLLNDSAADRYATDVSFTLKKIFQLSSAQQGSLKYAILDEVHRKAKAGEKTPIDLLELLKKTKNSGQALLTDKELEVFAGLQKELKKSAEGASKNAISDEDKIEFLIKSSAMLKAQGEIRGKGKQWSADKVWVKAASQAERNQALLREIKGFNSATSPDGQAQPEGTNTGAAE